MAKRRGKKKGARPPQVRKHVQGTKPQTVTPAKAPAKDGAWPSLVGLGLVGLGLLLTAYLTASDWLDESPAYCGAGSDCDLVQNSRWSVLLGLPLAFWGFLTYALLGGLLWRMRTRVSAWKHALSVAALGTGFSIYLTFVSVFEIQAVCLYCLASLALMAAILAVLCMGKPRNLQSFRWGNWGVGIAGALVLFVGAVHLHYQGLFDPKAGPESPYLRALAEHLETTGAAFYGASWCPACQDQKDLFAASAGRLPYVECSPAGRNGPVANACVSRRIGNYPTWIIDGQRHEGILTPEALARMSGFEEPATAAQ